MDVRELLPVRGHAPWRVRSLPRDERVLHVRLATAEEPQLSLCTALAKLGSYAAVDWYGLQSDRVAANILDVANATEPTLVFAQVQRGGVLTPSLLGDLRGLCSSDAVVIHWSGDVTDHYHPSGDHWTVDLGKKVDLMLFSCMSHVRAHHSQGMLNAAYLQVGFDEDRYFVGSTAPKYEMSFLAQVYPADFLQKLTLGTCEEGLRRHLGAAIRERYGLRAGVFGNGWGRSVTPGQSGAVYRASKFAVSASIASDLERYSSDRLLRALACGTSVLCKRFDDCESWGIRDGVNALLFDTVDDVFRLANDYGEPSRRELMGREGSQLAREHHSWSVRMAEMMVLVDAVRRRRDPRLEMATHSMWRPW